MKRVISPAFVITALAAAQLLARSPFVPHPAPIRSAEVERPGIAPAPAEETRQEKELEAAATKMWAERPRPNEEDSSRLLDLQPPAQRQARPHEQPRSQAQPRLQEQTAERRLSFAEARERMAYEQHDRAWWNERYNRIARAGTGYYAFSEGFWFPAFGYDPEFDVYPFDGPIYAVGDMTPDQEIAAIQTKLTQAGYYSGSITGVLDTATQQAISQFQTANDLLATGAIDEPTVEALGLG